jgi:hypothetical protein
MRQTSESEQTPEPLFPVLLAAFFLLFLLWVFDLLSLLSCRDIPRR